MLPLPLTTLIKQLRAAGFPLDPGREMRLRRVVHERGAEYIGRFGEMKYLLAPFVASRPEEQRNFYAFWDHYVAELEREWAGGGSQRKDLAATSGGWRWLLLPLLMLLAYGAFRYFNPKPSPPPGEQYAINIGMPGAAADSVYEKQIRLTEGDTLRLLNRTQGKLSGADSTGFTWRVENTQTGSVEGVYQTFALDMARPLVQGEGLRAILVGDHLGLPAGKSADTMLFVVQCAEPPLVPKIKVAEGAIEVGATHGFAIIDPEEGVTYDWGFSDGDAKGTSVSHAFTREGRVSVSVQAIRGGPENIASCYTLAFVEVQVVARGHDLPLLASIPLVRDEPHAFAARSTAYKWGKWLVLALIIGPLVWWKHRKETEARREKTDEEIAEAYPIFDQGPYNVPYRSRNDQISVPADFYRIADQLRVREESEARVFDGAATIEATVNSGGFPSWRERSLHRPADYLVLVTHSDEFNQQDLLLKRLTDFLSAREAAITVYYHEGQFEHFWNKEYPQGWSPDRLFDRYQQFRLLVLGNAHGLVDAYASREPRLEPTKAKWLNAWARRLVLTTEPAADWTAQEVLLHRHALLFPLTLRGLNEGVGMLNATEEYEPQDFPKWRALQQRNNPEPTARYRKWETVADHEEYFSGDRELMRWLRGLAVSGNPDWNLTIAIGRALNIDVTHDRLLQLSRIPWLAGNRPDHDLRFALLERLSPTDEAAARAAVVRELELVEDSVKGSFAQTEWQTNLAVHQLHLAPASAPQKESLREMIRAGLFTSDQLRDLELAAQRKESPVEEIGSKMAPPPPRPGGLDRLLAKDERDWWRTEPGQRFTGMLVILTGIALLVLSQLTPERQLADDEAVPWWADARVVDDAALEANNAAVDLWEATDASIRQQDGEISIEDAKNLEEIKGKLKEAWNLRGDNYPLVADNRWKASLNEEGYRLNAAYLDLAADKEVAFRDLLEEEDAIEWAGATPDDLSVSVEHQHGLMLLGLHQTLQEKYPLGEFSYERRNQLEKEFPGIRFQSSALTGLSSVDGKFPDGRDVRDLRAERDSLYADATGTLRLIEQVTNGLYFDSLTLVMPVNLRTMIQAINDAASNVFDPDAEAQRQDEQRQQEENAVTPPGNTQQTIPETDDGRQTDAEQDNNLVEANKLFDRYQNFRYNQVLNFESVSGRDQSSNVSKLINLLQRTGQNALPVAIDNKLLSSGSGATIYDGNGHNDAGLLLLRNPAQGLDDRLDLEFAKIKEKTNVLVITTDHSFNNSLQTGPDLMLNSRRLSSVFNSLDFNVESLRNPTAREFRAALQSYTTGQSTGQFIVVLNMQANEAGDLFLGGASQSAELMTTELISELQSITDRFRHSLYVNNFLVVGDVQAPERQTAGIFSNLSSSELLSLIQKSGNISAARTARIIIQQADNIVSLNNELISNMVKRSGGYDRNNKLLYPDDKAAVDDEFSQGAGSLIERRVTQYAELLADGYRDLRVGDAAQRVAALKQRFTDESLRGDNWDIMTFRDKTIAETIPILEEISAQVRAAEKAYLLALAKSLAAAGE